MPLRDHFRPPLDNIASWSELYGQWPAVIVQQLRKILPPGYVAGPQVHSGPQIEDEYEVRIHDATRGRRLVAAIEIISPANKDRPEHRNVFLGKCAALLQNGVAVSIVDVVTVRQFNLYVTMLELIGHSDPTLGNPPPDLYAASCRCVRREERNLLETWSRRLEIGDALPTLPLWLGADRSVPLDLEQSYEQACRDLWIS